MIYILSLIVMGCVYGLINFYRHQFSLQGFRMMMFWFSCIPMRLLMTYYAYDKPTSYIIPIVASMISIGFIYQYITQQQKIERGERLSRGFAGGKVYWHEMRVIHALMYGLVALNSVFGNPSDSWKILMADVLMGGSRNLLNYYVD